jgi:hypothetical protein
MEGDAHRDGDGLGVHVILWMHQVLCSFQGHDNLMHYDRDRVYLKCVSCGHESPGWELTEAPPPVRFQGDPQRHVWQAPPLVQARRVA